MPIPSVYRRAQEGAVASYDWTDIASGSGMITFYLGGLKNNSGFQYYMNENVFIPQSAPNTANFHITGAYYRVQTTNDTATKLIDLTFETNQFNRPRIIEGDVLFEIPCSSQYKTNTRATEHYIICILSKVSSGTTTTLLTSTSSTVAPGVDTAFTDYLSWKDNLSQTNLKIGDTLKLNVQVWGRRSDGESENVAFMLGHNPLNEATAAIGGGTEGIERVSLIDGKSQARISIPFKIDL
jgi:hypothetical protein